MLIKPLLLLTQTCLFPQRRFRTHMIFRRVLRVSLGRADEAYIWSLRVFSEAFIAQYMAIRTS